MFLCRWCLKKAVTTVDAAYCLVPYLKSKLDIKETIDKEKPEPSQLDSGFHHFMM